jgi:hypothetical protein
VEGIKKDMDAIKKNITEIEKKHGEALKATSKAVSSKTEDSLHKLMDTVSPPISLCMHTLLLEALRLIRTCCWQTSDLMQGVKNKLMSMKEDKDKAKKATTCPHFLLHDWFFKAPYQMIRLSFSRLFLVQNILKKYGQCGES